MRPDPASAARRVAEDIQLRRHSLPDDLDAVRPFLAAVAAGPGDEARVERWAAAFDALAQGRRNDLHVIIVDPRALARAAIALADAERAAAAAERWETFRDPAYFDMWCVRPKGEREFGRGFHVATEQEAAALAAALDAAVRRLAGLPAA